MAAKRLSELPIIHGERNGYGRAECCVGCRYLLAGFNTPDGHEYDECRRGIWFPRKSNKCKARRPDAAPDGE
jgi:hypothetical protein